MNLDEARAAKKRAEEPDGKPLTAEESCAVGAAFTRERARLARKRKEVRRRRAADRVRKASRRANR